MVELYDYQGLEQVTKYPELHSDETIKDVWEENYRIFSSEIQKNGKINFQVNQKNKASLLKLCHSLTKFLYNSKCFDLGINKYAELVNVLFEKANESLNLHHLWTQSIQETIEKFRLQKIEFEEELKILLDGKDEFNEPVLVANFTNVGELASTLPNLAGFNKKKIGLEKSIEFAIVYLEKLEICQDKLEKDFHGILQPALRNIISIQNQLEESREIQRELKAVNSIRDYMISPFLETKVSNFISRIPSLTSLIMNVQFQLSEFQFNYLSTTNQKDDLYSTLISLYENLAVDEVLLPMFQKDQENLRARELILREKVNDYSKTWIIKHFQKNLCKIVENISHVTNFLDSLQLIKTREHLKGVTELRLSAFIPSFSKLTIGNYKNQFFSTNDQKLIEKCINILCSNLSKVFQSCQSLKIGNSCTIQWTKHILEPINVKFSDLELKDQSEEYSKLFEKVKMIEKTIENLNDSFSKINLVSIKCMICPAILKTVISDSNFSLHTETLIQRHAFSGLLEISLISPKFLRMRNEKSLKFPFHQDFKKIRKEQLDYQAKIEAVQKKIDEKNVILEKIESEYRIIDYRLSQRFDFNAIDIRQLEYIYNDLLLQVDLNSLSVPQQYLGSLIGGVFSRITFRKSKMLKKAKKPNERNMITLSQFYENLENYFKAVESAKGLKFQNFSLNFFDFQQIDSRIILNSIISEEIIGSFLNDFDMPQSIVFERVDENIRKSIFEVCKNIAIVLLVQKKEFSSDKEILKHVNDFEKIFIQVTQEFK